MTVPPSVRSLALLAGHKKGFESPRRERRGISLPLRGTTVAERLLEAVLRAQQLTHAAAHAAGTYVDGFTLLRSVVVRGDAFERPA